MIRSECLCNICINQLDRVKRIWYLSPMRAAKVQASLRIRAVSPEPPLLAHTSSESRGPFRQKARSLAPLNGWACAVKICHDGMLEDTNSLDVAQLSLAIDVQQMNAKVHATDANVIVSFSLIDRNLVHLHAAEINEWSLSFSCRDTIALNIKAILNMSLGANIFA